MDKRNHRTRNTTNTEPTPSAGHQQGHTKPPRTGAIRNQRRRDGQNLKCGRAHPRKSMGEDLLTTSRLSPLAALKYIPTSEIRGRPEKGMGPRKLRKITRPHFPPGWGRISEGRYVFPNRSRTADRPDSPEAVRGARPVRGREKAEFRHFAPLELQYNLTDLLKPLRIFLKSF